MIASTNAKRVATPKFKKLSEKTKVETKSIDEILSMYQQYFLPPVGTPEAFRILDLSEGALVTYTSHT